MWGSNGRTKVVLALEDLGLGIMRQVPPGSWKVERMVRRSLFQLKSLDGKILSGGGKPWRHAASNMIVAPLNEAPPYSMGYLMVERSKGSSVNPGGSVFPGGAVSPVDFSLEKWGPLFEKYGGGLDITKVKFLKGSAHVPPIYREEIIRQEGEEESTKKLLGNEVAFRLAAIRETFEETGVLLARKGIEGHCPGEEIRTGNVLEEEFRDKKDVTHWQKRILKNPNDFVSLCDELKCIPDLWGLSEWNNWLTPTIYKAKSRFDVMFYMTLLEKMPRVSFDTHEVSSAQWAQPSSLLKEHKEGRITLMPPQVYEISRLENLKTISQLKEAMEIRRAKGLERYFPVIRAAVDGTVFLLPGDDLYPKTPDFEIYAKPDDRKFDKTLEELNSSGENFHRQWIPGKKGAEWGFKLNVCRYGHSY